MIIAGLQMVSQICLFVEYQRRCKAVLDDNTTKKLIYEAWTYVSTTENVASMPERLNAIIAGKL